MATPPSEKRVQISVEDALRRAADSHLAGDMDYAKYVCSSILQIDPGNAAARHHLSLLEGWRNPASMARRLIAPLLGPAPTIFDVGAHAGSITRVYREAFPDGTVHAFEPDPKQIAELYKSFGEDPQVIVNPVGVGDVEGVLTFNIIRGRGNDSISSFCDVNTGNATGQAIEMRQVDSVEAQVTTLDGYCAARGVDRIDFLKLDVQGFEDKCLRGAENLLRRQAIGLIQVELLLDELYSRTLSFYDIEAVLGPHGYRLYAIDDVYPRTGAKLFQLDAFYVPRRPAAG